MPTLTIYTTENCRFCHMTKRALSQQHIPYREEPLNDEMIATAKQHGFTSAPICQTSLGDLWGGYNRTKIKEFIKCYEEATNPATAVA